MKIFSFTTKKIVSYSTDAVKNSAFPNHWNKQRDMVICRDRQINTRIYVKGNERDGNLEIPVYLTVEN